MTEQSTQNATLHSGFEAPMVFHHINFTSGSCCDHLREDVREEEQSHFAGLISYALAHNGRTDLKHLGSDSVLHFVRHGHAFVADLHLKSVQPGTARPVVRMGGSLNPTDGALVWSNMMEEPTSVSPNVPVVAPSKPWIAAVADISALHPGDLPRLRDTAKLMIWAEDLECRLAWGFVRWLEMGASSRKVRLASRSAGTSLASP